MCGAYGFNIKDAREVYTRFDIINTLDDYEPRYNLRPGQMNPVVTSHSPNRISRMFWGLLPHFAKDEKYKYKTINAKAETVASLPSFAEPFRHKRCLVPATGFYEPDKKSRTAPPYTWHYFKLKRQPLFAFAGLYDIWTDRETDKEIYSYTIITTTPNSIVGKFHDRMPVILKREDEKLWLDPDVVDPEKLQSYLKPYHEGEMQEWEVGSEARNPRNDYPELIKPAEKQAPLLK